MPCFHSPCRCSTAHAQAPGHRTPKRPPQRGSAAPSSPQSGAMPAAPVPPAGRTAQTQSATRHRQPGSCQQGRRRAGAASGGCNLSRSAPATGPPPPSLPAAMRGGCRPQQPGQLGLGNCIRWRGRQGERSGGRRRRRKQQRWQKDNQREQAHLKMREMHSAVRTSTGQPGRPSSAMAPPRKLSNRGAASLFRCGRRINGHRFTVHR